MTEQQITEILENVERIQEERFFYTLNTTGEAPVEAPVRYDRYKEHFGSVDENDNTKEGITKVLQNIGQIQMKTAYEYAHYGPLRIPHIVEYPEYLDYIKRHKLVDNTLV